MQTRWIPGDEVVAQPDGPRRHGQQPDLALLLGTLDPIRVGPAVGELEFGALFARTRDAIFVVDDSGRYIDANPAASLLLGLTREELIGRRLVTHLADFEDDVDLDAAWHGFLAAGDANGEVRLARPDGTSRYAEYTATAEVAPGRHFGILRDVTERRWAEQLAAQRARIIEAFHRMRPGATPELTAEAVCAEIVGHADISNAAIFAFNENGTVTTLASTFAMDRSARLPTRIAGAHAAQLLDGAAHGAWIETFADPQDDRLRSQLAALGITDIAFAPIEVGGEIVGLLAAGDRLAVIDRPVLLESVEDFAALAASLLGGPLSERRRVDADARHIERIVSGRTFRPVFQPIVDLASRKVIGYEALTRFDDGVAPDLVFATAARCDRGIALEVATIGAALDDARRLPAGMSIHVNVSPALIVAPETLGRLVRRSGLDIVLEVTEHAPVADYGKLRAAVRDIGTPVKLAVDDTGAGFASLRHILELQPEIVKLDRAFVAGIDHDPARQALVAGMVRFANGIGALLVGEGIETEGERETLMRLGARAGQGFLLGRPVPAPGHRGAARPSLRVPKKSTSTPGRLPATIA
jgi:PAS domain S-box-containing protein